MEDEQQSEEDEKFLFKGENLNCEKMCFGQSGLLCGSWNNFEHRKAFTSLGHLYWIKEKMVERAAIRRIRFADCRDDWEKTVLRCQNLDANNVIKIFAFEDDKLKWR